MQAHGVFYHEPSKSATNFFRSGSFFYQIFRIGIISNINKTVSAAIRQIEDIRYIEETTGFSSLPEPLEQMARLRLQYPEASLLELGKMLTPVVGKSGVNHRLRKLKEIAEDLRRKQGGEVL